MSFGHAMLRTLRHRYMQLPIKSASTRPLSNRKSAGVHFLSSMAALRLACVACSSARLACILAMSKAPSFPEIRQNYSESHSCYMHVESCTFIFERERTTSCWVAIMYMYVDMYSYYALEIRKRDGGEEGKWEDGWRLPVIIFSPSSWPSTSIVSSFSPKSSRWQYERRISATRVHLALPLRRPSQTEVID